MALLLFAFATACRVSVDYSGTQYQCDEQGRCPPGFECRAGRCVPLGQADAGGDAPSIPDGATADADLTDGAPVDADVTPGCGTTARLVDDFDDGLTGPQWAAGFEDIGATRAEEDGQLVIRVSAGAGDVWAGYSSRHVHDLAGHHVQIRVDQVGPLFTVLEVRHHSGPRAQLLETEGTVRAAVYGLPSGNGERVEIPYDSVAHRWWRVREQNGVLYWELSPDAASWTTLHQEPDPFPLDMVYVLLSAGGAVATDSETRMDNLNPDGDPDEPWCPIANLNDDFEDSAIHPQWGDSWAETGCTLVETGGEAALVFDGTPDSWCGYDSAPVYDACDGQVAVELASDLDVADAEMWLSLHLLDADSKLSFGLWSGELHMIEEVGPDTPMTVSLTYSPSQHQWWRIRESAGTLYWETSPNGVAWTTRASHAAGHDCSTAYVDFGAGLWNTWTAGATEARFDNFNRLP